MSDASKPEGITPEPAKPPETAPTPEPAKPAEAAAPPKPALPPKPAPPKPPAKTDPDRRGVLAALGVVGSAFAIAWITMTAALTGWLLGTVRFLFPNVLSEPPSKFKVGFP